MIGFHTFSVMLLLGTLSALAEKFNESFIEAEYFIDRTNFLELFFTEYRHPDHPIFISAPSGFGKTTIISMMEAFFKIQSTKNGTAISPEETKNHKLFTQPHKRGNLAISKSPFFKEHFGKYPVVALDFKQLRVTNYAAFLDSIKKMMLDASTEHEYILEVSKNISNYGSFKKISSVDFKSQDKTYELILRHSGKVLTQALSEHFGKECIVLIDDFDLPAMETLFAPLDEAEISKIIQFFVSFLSSLLKGNKFLKAGFLTGRVQFGGKNSRGIDNVDHEHFSARANVATSFGLSKPNLEDLATRYARTNLTLKKVVEYYDGYRVQKSNLRVFPTRSVVQSFIQGKLAAYWSPDVDEKTLYKAFRLDQLGHDILFAMSGKPLKTQLQEAGGLTELLQLKTYLDSMQAQKDTVTEKLVVKFYQYLYELGYFTTKPVGTETELSIPNREVEVRLNDLVQRALQEQFKYDAGHVDRLVESIKKLNGSKEEFQEFVNAVQSLFDKSLDGLSLRDIRGVTYSAFVKNFDETSIKDSLNVTTSETTLMAYVSNSANKTGIAIGYVFEESSEKAIKRIVEGNCMKPIVGFKNDVLIGLNFDPNTKLFSASYLCNSFDLKKAKKIDAVEGA